MKFVPPGPQRAAPMLTRLTDALSFQKVLRAVCIKLYPHGVHVPHALQVHSGSRGLGQHVLSQHLDQHGPQPLLEGTEEFNE